MFTIEKQSKLQLRPPEFLCDRPIHQQIQDPLPKTPFFMAIIGSAGSGKTSMMVNLLTSCQAYKKAYHAVHIVMPSHSVASLKKNVFKNHARMPTEECAKEASGQPRELLTGCRFREQVRGFRGEDGRGGRGQGGGGWSRHKQRRGAPTCACSICPVTITVKDVAECAISTRSVSFRGDVLCRPGRADGLLRLLWSCWLPGGRC